MKVCRQQSPGSCSTKQDEGWIAMRGGGESTCSRVRQKKALGMCGTGSVPFTAGKVGGAGARQGW